jgi:hypothetical protein
MASEASASKSTFLSPSRFLFVVDGGLSYHCTTIELPTVTVDGLKADYRQHQISIPGTKLVFSPFTATFIVEEDLGNYITLLEWMISGAKDQNDMNENKKDLTLLIYSNNNKVSKAIKYIGAFPTSVSTIDFSTMLTETEYPKCSVSFDYDYFHITDHE